MNQRDRISLKAYISGFGLSLGLTLGAYWLVHHYIHSSSHSYAVNTLIGAIIGLALVQFFVQMMFFLHLGAERKPRWNLITFGIMGTVVIILVLGSLWIMHNLNYTMSPQQTNSYIIKDEGFSHN